MASQVVASFTARPQGQAQATPQGSHDNLNLARITCLQLYLLCIILITVQFYPIHAITAYENKIIMQTPTATCTLYILHCTHAVVRYSQEWSLAAAASHREYATTSDVSVGIVKKFSGTFPVLTHTGAVGYFTIPSQLRVRHI